MKGIIAPFISVVVTTFNRKELLKETIDSILNQTYKNFELIVVDNYSNYDFMTYIKSFNDNRIRAYQNQNKGIIAVNRNFGIKKAKGEYVAFCDDDDLWLPRKLEQVVKYINTNPKAILFCHYEELIKDGIPKGVLKHGPASKNMYDTLLFKGNRVSTSATTVKKENAILVKGFSEVIDFVTVEDYDFWIKLSKYGDFVFIPEVLGKYFLTKDSMSRNIVAQQKASLSLKKNHLDIWLISHPEKVSKVNKTLSKLLTSQALALLKESNVDYAFKKSQTALQHSKLYYRTWVLFFLSYLLKSLNKLKKKDWYSQTN